MKMLAWLCNYAKHRGLLIPRGGCSKTNQNLSIAPSALGERALLDEGGVRHTAMVSVVLIIRPECAVWACWLACDDVIAVSLAPVRERRPVRCLSSMRAMVAYVLYMFEGSLRLAPCDMQFMHMRCQCALRERGSKNAQSCCLRKSATSVSQSYRYIDILVEHVHELRELCNCNSY